MSSKHTDYETAIAEYRAQLRAEAELADGDLDEIEDHLRSLTDDLRSHGMPAAEAVTEAARRLGEPRSIAREHNRVRSAFGSRLSGARTWSVVVLLAPMLVFGAINMYSYVGLWSRYMAEFLAGAGLVTALVLRLGWARPVLLGGMAYFLIPSIVATSIFSVSPIYLVWHVGIIAFLVPWRRNELTPTGLALVAYVWAYGAASYALSFQMTTSDGSYAFFGPTALVACIAAAAATTGAILRARWSSFAGVIVAASLCVSLYEVTGIHYRFSHPSVLEVAIFGSLLSGALAALTGSVLAWRSARSALGSLRAIRS